MLVFIGTSFIGCESDDDDNSGQGEIELSTTITGTENFPELSGEGNVISLNNEFTANVTINGAEPDSEHPWHVHEGTCATGGGIVGPPDEYALLEVSDEGSAEATATIIGTGLSEDGNYHINVHLSADDLGTIIGCGDLNGDNTI
ncbi:MAG: CHRD domain-containing protein [Balneolales bacterium]